MDKTLVKVMPSWISLKKLHPKKNIITTELNVAISVTVSICHLASGLWEQKSSPDGENLVGKG